MTQLTRPLSSDVIGSLLQLDGKYQHAVCIEAEFGSKIAADSNGEADTLIEYEGNDILLATSVDDGQTFQVVPPAEAEFQTFAQRKIPNLGVGQVVTNKKVIARAYFTRPASSVTQIRTRVALENGDVFDHSAANADLESPGPTGVTTLGSRGVVRREGRVTSAPERGMRFGGAATAVREVTPTQSPGDETGTHTSRGISGSFTGSGNLRYVELQDGNTEDPDGLRFQKAATTFEAWIYFPEEPAAGEYAICNWSTTFQNSIGTLDQRDDGVRFYIDHNGTSGRLRLLTREVYIGGLASEEKSVDTARVEWGGRWRHVAFQYDGLGIIVFLDGVESAGEDFDVDGATGDNFELRTGLVLPTDGNFNLGSRPRGRGSLPGIITEARLWYRAIDPQKYIRRRMTAAEAAELHADGLLAALWPLTNDANDIGPAGLHLEPRDGAGIVSIPNQFLGLTPPRTSLTPGDPPRRVPYWDIQMMDISTDSNLLRICSGLSKITFDDAREFTATGQLLEIGESIKERGEVDPDVGLTFTLTGLDPQLLSIAMNAAYADRPIRLYLVTLNEHGGIVGGDPTSPIWEGRMDQMVPLMRTEGEGKDQRTILTIGVKAETHLRDFDRQSPYKWNQEAHRSQVDPDDAGFDETAATAERQELWPRPEDLEETEAPLA